MRHQPKMLNFIFGESSIDPYWIADMDFEIAEPISKELSRIAERGRYAYEFDGESVLSAISHWYQHRHNLTLNKAQFVQVPGVLTGLALIVRELTNEGDGIIIQTPVYHQFKKIISSAGRKVITSPLLIKDGKYKIDFDDLAEKFALDNVNTMIFCNPHNPVGRVWTEEELTTLIALANKHGVTIISDEIHSDIIYSGHSFNSIIQHDDNKHVALLGSPAKTFGMQSISNGYIYTENEEVLEKLLSVTDSMYLGHGNAFTTFATIAAYQHGEAWLDELLTYLENTVSWVESFVADNLPGVKLYPVEGTYQIWLNFTDTGLSAEKVKSKLVEAKMGLTPGSWFGDGSELFWRMNIATPLVNIQNSFEQLKEALKIPD